MMTALPPIEKLACPIFSIGRYVLPRRSGAVAIATGLVWLALAASPIRAQDKIDPNSAVDLEPNSPPPSTSPDGADVTRFVDELLQDANKYATGTGHAYNPARAFELYKKAAESGNVTAVYEVARFMILGEGTPKNEAKGIAILNDLAAVLIQGKDFRHIKGVNPVTKASFKDIKDLRRPSVNIANFKTKAGNVIEGPEVLSIYETGPRLMHSTGVSAFTWEELPAFVQLAIGYDKASSYFQTAIEKALAAKK